jgi:predicted dehydrogenase
MIDDGWIGRPVAGTAFMMNHGPEHWHPAPDFYYAPGGGPLFDMGPYYLTALVSLLGPVAGVTGNCTRSFDGRLVTSAPHYGKTISVTTPTHISALLDFEGGASLSMIMSFDVWNHSLPHIEIYGSEGTLQIGDPNYFISPLRLRRHRDETWHDIPLAGPSDTRKLDWLANDNWRGIGVTDMALAIGENRAHRASGDLALHVLEVMTRIIEAAENGAHRAINHSCARPASLN